MNLCNAFGSATLISWLVFLHFEAFDDGTGIGLMGMGSASMAFCGSGFWVCILSGTQQDGQNGIPK